VLNGEAGDDHKVLGDYRDLPVFVGGRSVSVCVGPEDHLQVLCVGVDLVSLVGALHLDRGLDDEKAKAQLFRMDFGDRAGDSGLALPQPKPRFLAALHFDRAARCQHV
jgi:hypothetical protein